ncbi:hypothetical protein [Thiorhodovibrio winogradskyi]|uniref:hypothetical protein n=1 Tax=Thiorhodovibrio winogradskyi TaxID=77007 RepID=UPI002E29AC07|nr:hypothetical protein [Thiorhodovibrio winogradskyi]
MSFRTVRTLGEGTFVARFTATDERSRADAARLAASCAARPRGVAPACSTEI